MNRLSAFLHPAATQETAEVVVSRRFLDEKGNPVPFKIRSLTQEENDGLVKRSTRTMKGRSGQSQERLDNIDYTRRLLVAATVEPDFTSKELCDTYGVMDPLLVPGRMLLIGEFQKLMEEIMTLSGLDGAENVEDAAKN